MRRIRPAALLAALLPLVPLAATTEDTEKTVNKLVKLVRYEKDDDALKLLDGEGQGAILLGDEWAKGTPAQREEFVKLFHGLFAAMAFPNLRKNLEHLETMLCEPPKVVGYQARS